MMMSRLQLMQAINLARDQMIAKHEGEDSALLAGIGIMADALRTSFFGEFSEVEFTGEHDLMTTGEMYWIVYVEPTGYTVICDSGIPITLAREFFSTGARA